MKRLCDFRKFENHFPKTKEGNECRSPTLAECFNLRVLVCKGSDPDIIMQKSLRKIVFCKRKFNLNSRSGTKQSKSHVFH